MFQLRPTTSTMKLSSTRSLAKSARGYLDRRGVLWRAPTQTLSTETWRRSVRKWRRNIKRTGDYEWAVKSSKSLRQTELWYITFTHIHKNPSFTRIFSSVKHVLNSLISTLIEQYLLNSTPCFILYVSSNKLKHFTSFVFWSSLSG